MLLDRKLTAVPGREGAMAVQIPSMFRQFALSPMLVSNCCFCTFRVVNRPTTYSAEQPHIRQCTVRSTRKAGAVFWRGQTKLDQELLSWAISNTTVEFCTKRVGKYELSGTYLTTVVQETYTLTETSRVCLHLVEVGTKHNRTTTCAGLATLKEQGQHRVPTNAFKLF